MHKVFSVADRGPVDVVMALGLIHHLAIGINVPLGMIAKMFSRLASNLIIEFIPKGDSQLDKLLNSRKDVFTEYYEDQFRAAFSEYFTVVKSDPIPGTKRVLYGMSVKVN